MKRFIIILSYALCLTLLSCSAGRTPKSTIKTFFNSIEKGEYVKALEHTTLAEEGDTELYCAIMDKERKSIAEKGGIEKIEILNDTPSLEDENRHTINALITYGNGSTHEECCELVKIENKWKIDVNFNSK